MHKYLELGRELVVNGQETDSRSGRVRTLLGQQFTWDMKDGFPLLQSKYINFDHIKHELVWYLKGTDKITYLKENEVKIWNLWADENDSIGPTYGVQWRNFEGIDQVDQVIQAIREGGDRRMIINGWNPLRLSEMALPPCLVLMQFHLIGAELSMTVYQRSGDFCLGVPYDIAEMALLLDFIARITNRVARHLTVQYGDLHIYENHIETFTMKQYIAVLPNSVPQLHYEKVPGDLFKSYRLVDYKPGTKLRYEVAK